MSTGCEILQKMPATWMILKKDLNFLEGSRNICCVFSPHQSASKSFKVRPLLLEVSIFGEKNVIKQKLKLNRETKIKVFFLQMYTNRIQQSQQYQEMLRQKTSQFVAFN